MADKAHIAVDKKLAVMEKRISAIYSEAQEDLQKKADKYFKQFEEADQKKRKLVEQGKLTEDEYKKWRKGKIARGKQFTAMKEQVAENLLHTNEIAIAYINGEIPDVYALGYNALAPTVEGVGGYSFTLVDADTVRTLATTDTSLLPYKKLNHAKDIAWNMQSINSQIAQGIIQGESIPQMSKRVFGEIMKTSNTENLTDKELGALLRKNKQAAIRTARTIVTGAENKGRMDSYKRAEADGIILQKEWLSSNQPGRTRDWHFPSSFESLEVDTDQPFINGMGEIMFPGDPSAKPANVYNCRCSMRAVVKGFGKKQSIGLPNETFEKPLDEQQIKKTVEKSKSTEKQTKPTTTKPIKTDYTMKQLENKSRKDLEKIAREVARKNATKQGLTENEALRRFDLLVSSNTTPQLRKYINKYGR